MENEKGKKARIRYRCRLEDGRACHFGEGDILELVVGAGTVPLSLEAEILGMQPGEHRTIRIPASDVKALPFAKAVESETPPGIAYEFGPGDGGDVDEFIPPRPRHSREALPAGLDLYLDIELLAVE